MNEFRVEPGEFGRELSDVAAGVAEHLRQNRSEKNWMCTVRPARVEQGSFFHCGQSYWFSFMRDNQEWDVEIA